MAPEVNSVPLAETQVVSSKKKTAVTTSWISIDAKGQGMILDVDKCAIMRRVQIHTRDLRILDPMLSYPCTILGREKVIVLNLEILLRDPYDENVIPLVGELKRRLPQDNLTCQGQGGEEEQPGEHNNIDTEEENVALEAICSFLDARTRELETDTYPALDELTSKISSRNLDRVRKLKSAMTRLTNRVQKVRDELEQLLDDDDDMADLYLSRKLAGACSPVSSSGVPNWYPPSPTIVSKISRTSRTSAVTVHEENDVEELEMLLEVVDVITCGGFPLVNAKSKADLCFWILQAYFMQIDSTLNKLTTLREYIDDTEDYINIQLDNHRNQLIQLELLVSSGTVCLSVYSLVLQSLE
ncbi:hypothetical protein V6N13_079444 [Hibiscus sabdariffa]